MVVILALILVMLLAITGVIVVAACALSSRLKQGREWEETPADAKVNNQQTPAQPVNVADL